jgi:hypothetical protein
MMPIKHVGAVYLVDIACFSMAVQKKSTVTPFLAKTEG